ncbi:acyl transferase/acyl hydrolase/lysophospholipase, partial [Podospora fimiseda]
RVPTTGDVHLYADPSSYLTRTPLLHADCEGLDGGEAVPRGLRHRSKGKDDRSSNMNEQRKKLKKTRHGSERNILWAVSSETKKREYAVTELYPRLLYTFSDVVVFVLRNPRSFESTVLEKLIDWGAASINKSVNQPTLPHAIIVLNATDQVDDKEWDVDTATQLLLDDINDAISRVPRLEDLSKGWRETGRKIANTKDLLDCYYASVSIVRIPSRGRYMLMDDQVEKLFQLIKQKARQSLDTKKEARMLATAEQLQVYLQAAYDHFSKDLSTPFDFIKEALRHNPIPRDLGGNILNLALSIKENSSDAKIQLGDTAKVFSEITFMIASCIILDSVRQNLLGTTLQLLNDAYVEFCEYAVDRFDNFYAPCQYVSSRYGRCRNFKSGHSSKGHQNAGGKIIGSGGYQSAFSFDDFMPEWIASIQDALLKIQVELDDPNRHGPGRGWGEGKIAVELQHRHTLNWLYRRLGDATNFVSHTTCFSCLRELPEHRLPCGHVLCGPCTSSYGAKISKTVIELKNCPLHYEKTSWNPPWLVKVKPAFAGTRILCLDGGGGVRAIVQLHALKAIERVLGPALPIQCFLDLIVGTGTGGILALGLGTKNWPVNDCIHQLKELCVKAFTIREMIGIPILEKLSLFNHHSMYKTKPLEAILKERFEAIPLFGGAAPIGSAEMATKVAVTSTTAHDNGAVVIANYNRLEVENYEIPYKFLRSDGPYTEFQIWEAARATSAAPPFFKPFVKETGISGIYKDGGYHHNNPVLVAQQERKLIWNDVAGSHPDILLSLGIGTNNVDKDDDRSIYSSGGDSVDGSKDGTSPTKPNRPSIWTGLSLDSLVKDVDRFMASRDIWDNFVSEHTAARSNNNSGSSRGNHRRYIRLNPDLQLPLPRLDDVEALDNLERAAAANFKRNSVKIQEIAHRLVASSFFFEKDPSSVQQKNGKGTWKCKGQLHCRFDPQSSEMYGLGRFLQDCTTSDFEPFFLIEDRSDHKTAFEIPLPEIISSMCLRGVFNPPNVYIPISKELSTINIYLCLQSNPYPHSANGYLPISGFPRELVSEEIKPRGLFRPALVAARRSDDDKRGAGGNPQRYRSVRERDQNSTANGIPAVRRTSPHSDLRGAFGATNGRPVPETPDDVGMMRTQSQYYELEA